MPITEQRKQDGAVLKDEDRELVHELEEAATELWGDEWAISIRRWADGDATIYAEHCEGLTEDGDRKNHRLMPNGEGGFGHDVVVETKSETVQRDVVTTDV